MTVIVFQVVHGDVVLSRGSDFNLPRAYQSAVRLQRAHSSMLSPARISARFCLPGGDWISAVEFAKLVAAFVANQVPVSGGPKSLAERLNWMAKNLPGFNDELQAVTEARNRAIAKARGQS